MLDLSIIIVNYKTPELINSCLDSLEAHTRGISYEVLIVDNQSEDDSQHLIQARHPGIHWFQMGYNSGFARANNYGIRQAQGRYILLLNSDTLLVSDLVANCVRLMDQQPDVAALSALQVGRDGRLRPNLFTTFGQIRRSFYILPIKPAFQQVLYRLFPDTQYPDPQQVDWLSGAFLMTRPEVIARAGALDESFFMYGEDVEWGHRLGQHGRLLLISDDHFVHFEYGSSDHQQHVVTYINRFKPQIQVSQLLWVRKQYGPMAYLILMLHYLLMVPIVFFWKIAVNLRNGQSPWAELDNQRAFATQVGIFFRFFWKTLLNRQGFYKV
ncbi:glycosyltransferase family 2 protein [Spirosoma fluminis]